ncbi:MAG: patatin-like phospholipase family protein [Stappiaceae bacterium]
MSTRRIGLALGGGGARGMAHIPVLEALDELGIQPVAMSGTSIGAILGAGYAAGRSGEEIREYAVRTFKDRGKVLARMWNLRPKKFSEFMAGGGVSRFDAHRVIDQFVGDMIPERFDDLKIPFSAIATDFYSCKEVDIRSGDLHGAIAASIAIPALFKPVHFEDRIMIDGGIVNPLPFDVLPPNLDIVIAVDVVGSPLPNPKRKLPSASESVFGATQIFMQSIAAAKLKLRQPDILIKPDIPGFRVLDFLKTEKILKSAEPMKDEIKRRLDLALAA